MMRAGLQSRDRGHMDNVVRRGPPGQVATRTGQSLEDRSNCRSMRQTLYQFVRDVARVEGGENQDIGCARGPFAGRFATGNFRQQGRIRLQFAGDDRVGSLDA